MLTCILSYKKSCINIGLHEPVRWRMWYKTRLICVHSNPTDRCKYFLSYMREWWYKDPTDRCKYFLSYTCGDGGTRIGGVITVTTQTDQYRETIMYDRIYREGSPCYIQSQPFIHTNTFTYSYADSICSNSYCPYNIKYYLSCIRRDKGEKSRCIIYMLTDQLY